MDKVSAADRSRIMSRVKQKNTKPEIIVRSLLHHLGFRFRLPRKPHLPGRPDVIFPKRRKVIFIHGCFWHGHDCPRGKRPSSNQTFWNAKLDRNTKRDAEAVDKLQNMGWDVKIVWECELRDLDRLRAELESFLRMEAGLPSPE